MALYAFDGTMNTDDTNDDKLDSNVVRFRDAYDGTIHYEKGVGLRFGAAGRFFGGTFGAGGEQRVDSAYKRLGELWAEGDKTIDIVGFSRGAALALDFGNRIARRGVPGSDEEPRIRFLGLWDTVGSFGFPMNLGIPFHRINLGKNLRLPPNVDLCCHALSLNERRQAFRPSRLNPKGDQPNVREVWFKGVHSDVGGGKAIQLSSIALSWMFDHATRCGLEFKPGLCEAAAGECDASVAPSKNSTDPIENALRRLADTDLIHPSAVTPEALANTDDELKELLPKLKVETL